MKKLKYEIIKGDDNQFFFQLKYSNGSIILQSDGYSTREECVKSITATKENAIYNERYKRSQTANGKYFFKLFDNNDKYIASGREYSTQRSRDKAIDIVKSSAPNALVSSVVVKYTSVPQKSTDLIDSFKRKLKSNRWFAIVSIITTAIIAISTILGAMQKISTSFSTYYDSFFRRSTDFTIQGNLEVKGSTNLPTDIVVRIMWLIEEDARDEEGNLIKKLNYVQSPEISRIDPNSDRLGYKLVISSANLPDDAIISPPSEIGIATGVIIAFQDTDGNGSYSDENDHIIATPPTQVVLYLPSQPEDLLKDSQMRQGSITFFDLSKGFNIAKLEPIFLDDRYRFLDVESSSPVTIDLETSKGILEKLNKLNLISE